MKQVLTLLSLFVFAFLIVATEAPEKKESASEPKKEVVFDSLSLSEKKKLLKDFINGNEPYKNANANVTFMLMDAFKGVVKFPKTLEFQWSSGSWAKIGNLVKDSKIIDANKGILETKGVYRSENSLSMKVQNNYRIRYTFDGKSFDVLDAELK